MRLRTLAALGACLLLAAACGQRTGSTRLDTAGTGTPDGSTPAAPIAATMPPFPTREPSGLTDMLHLGKDAAQRSSGAEVLEPMMRLNAQSQAQFAVYRFGLDGAKPDGLNLDLQPVSGEGAWVALADCVAKRWYFYGPYSGTANIANLDVRFVSSAGNLWVAVVAMDAVVDVGSLTLTRMGPAVKLKVSHGIGKAPLTVNFDASESYWDEPGFASFEWDWESDGTVDATTASPVQTHVYDHAFQGHVTLKVVTSTGAAGVATAPIRSCQPYSTKITNYDWARLLEIDGRPAVFYYDRVSHAVRLVRASDAAGTEWLAPQTLDFVGYDGPSDELSLGCATINQHPAIAYCDMDSYELRFLRANDPSGATWGDPVTVDPGAAMVWYGRNNSIGLAEVDGRPALTFRNYSIPGLLYARSKDPDGSSWEDPVQVDPGDYCGAWSSLRVIEGKPAVAYSNDQTWPNGQVRYCRAQDEQGRAWGTPQPILWNSSANEISLATYAGKPVVSYRIGYSVVQLTVAYDTAGEDWGSTAVVYDGTDSTFPSSLEVVDGTAWLGIRDEYGYVCLTQALSSAGDSWSPLNRIERGGVPTLAVINGTRALCYRSFDLGEMVYMAGF